MGLSFKILIIVGAGLVVSSIIFGGHGKTVAQDGTEYSKTLQNLPEDMQRALEAGNVQRDRNNCQDAGYSVAYCIDKFPMSKRTQ